jgi:hypothetical protein
MRNRLYLLAGAMILVVALGQFFAKPLLAQVRAALVQNVDEPGRSPYQESQFNFCPTGSVCDYNFAAVPPGKRLVLTNVSGFVDAQFGTLPNVWVTKIFSGLFVFFPGTRQTVHPGATRIVYNSEVKMYFDAGEQPNLTIGLPAGSTDRLLASRLTLGGYYVSVP